MLNRLLITGADGTIGTVCRNRLQHVATKIRLGVQKNVSEMTLHEEVFEFGLEDYASVKRVVANCDGIIHLAGQPVEAPWKVIRNANIDGIIHLYEAVRNLEVKPRILFASSSHVVGYYPKSQTVDARVMPKPDGLYGASKAFGECVAQVYYEKFGIETACVRIGTFGPKPKNTRMLSTWFSHDDFVALVERVFSTPRLGCPIIYGVSANTKSWWDNHSVKFLGWTPKDNADVYQAEIGHQNDLPPVNASKNGNLFQGGAFCDDGIHEDTNG